MGVKFWIALLIVLVQGIFCRGEIFEIVIKFCLKTKLTLFVKKQPGKFQNLAAKFF